MRKVLLVATIWLIFLVLPSNNSRVHELAAITDPDVSTLTVMPNPTNCAPTVVVLAVVDDSLTGNTVIQQAEYFVDVVGADGTGAPMVSDGFDSPTEVVVAVIDVTALSPGVHILYVHGQDATGNWGAVQSVSLLVICPGINPSEDVNRQIRPLAQVNIQKAEDLLNDVNDMLSQGKTIGAGCEEILNQAETFFMLAQDYFAAGNYIAANNYALKAANAYEEAIECLKGS